jgi:hypothetical protein
MTTGKLHRPLKSKVAAIKKKVLKVAKPKVKAPKSAKGARPKEKRKNAGLWPCPWVDSDHPNLFLKTSKEAREHEVDAHLGAFLALYNERHPGQLPPGTVDPNAPPLPVVPEPERKI